MIVDLPTLDHVHKMGIQELVRVLRHCPLCETFGKPAEEILVQLNKR